jgi:hypothetical protein
MNPTIRNIFKHLESSDTEEKVSMLVDVADWIQAPGYNSAGFPGTIQELIRLASIEQEPKVQKQMFRNISLAYMQRFDLSGMDFEPLITGLKNRGPVFINSVLFLLSMTYDKKYIEIISGFINHPDKKVSEEAQYILDTW